MAEKRMFSKQIIDSDAFLDMPLSTQCLYFHLSMRADDDGFIGNHNRIMRTIGANKNDLDILIAKSFILTFESGVIVIKHWRINNYLRADRYKPTLYSDEKSMISVKENQAYTYDLNLGIPDGIPVVDADKNRLDKSSIDKKREDNLLEKTTSRFIPPSLSVVSNYCKERDNEIDAQSFIDFYESKGWMIGKNKMKDWKAAIRSWETRNKPKKKETGYELPRWGNGLSVAERVQMASDGFTQQQIQEEHSRRVNNGI